jgi:hypothetical protein
VGFLLFFGVLRIFLPRERAYPIARRITRGCFWILVAFFLLVGVGALIYKLTAGS